MHSHATCLGKKPYPYLQSARRSEAALPVNILDLREHQLQAAKQDDVRRLIPEAGVSDISVEAVALHNGPAAGNALSIAIRGCQHGGIRLHIGKGVSS